jgi:Kef-type K+ transport system membrane component KefB
MAEETPDARETHDIYMTLLTDNASVEAAMFRVIVQLVVIIAIARISGNLFRRMGQPSVCGEIAAGIILGPSLFGKFFPATFQAIFDPGVTPVFNILSQLGLILVMFLMGFEFDFDHLPDNRSTAFSVSVAGIVLPFSLGFALGKVMHAQLALSGSWINFSLFMATAMSITAIPVLGRIMIELNIARTRIGSITISAAAINDTIGWTILALITAVVRSTFDPMKLATMIGSVIVYALVMAFVMRPLVARWAAWTLRQNSGDLSLNGMAVLLVLVLLSSAVTNWIGIFSLFGAFMMGAILYDQTGLRDAVHRRLNDFVTTFFLPIFFTYTGLRTDVGQMVGGKLWLFCGLVLVCAVAGMYGGCSWAARWNGVSRREASIIGVMMNARGLTELIVINVGYELGILPKSVFFMLVFMAVATTYMTTPVLRRLFRGSELWESYRLSAFETARGAGTPAAAPVHPL